VADLVVTAACLLVSPAILGPRGLALGIANIPVAWIAARYSPGRSRAGGGAADER